MTFIFPQYSLLTEQDFWESQSEQQPIILFGAGAIGKLVYDYLIQRGVSVKCFCDNNTNLQGTYYEDCPIIALEKAKLHEAQVIICSKYEEDMTKQLQQLGVEDHRPVYSLFSGQEISDELCKKHLHALCAIKSEMDKAIVKKQIADPLIIDSLDIVITEKCSLKCRDCSNLMQYYQQPEHENETDIFSALDNLMQAVDWVCELRVLGGEPFMNKKIAKYLDRLCQYPKNSYIVVYSNATIMPDEQAWASLKQEKVVLLLSDYGILSKQLNPIAAKAETENIKYQINTMEEWQDCAKIAYHERSEQEVKDIYKQCCVRETLTLKDRRLYGCPFSANATKLKAIPDFREDYIELLSPPQKRAVTADEIREFLRKAYYLACQYCNGRPVASDAMVLPAVQTPEPLKYDEY